MVLAVVGGKMLAHSWLKAWLGPNFNFYLLGLVLLILATGVVASWLHRDRPTGSRQSQEVDPQSAA